MKVTFDPQGIAEQQKVCEAATPEPWEVQRLGRYEDHDECQIDLPDDDIELAKYENADFIALSRTAYPAALTEILRLQTEAAALRKQVASMQAERDEMAATAVQRCWIVRKANEVGLLNPALVNGHCAGYSSGDSDEPPIEECSSCALCVDNAPEGAESEGSL